MRSYVLISLLFIKSRQTMLSSRRFFVGGNWKLNGNFSSIDGIIANLNNGGVSANADVVGRDYINVIKVYLLTK